MAGDISVCSSNTHTRESVAQPAQVADGDFRSGRAPELGDTVRLLAQQFESLLLGQMLRDMQPEQSGDQSNGFGGALTDTIYGELGNALVKAGGIGLATSLEDAMARTTPGAEPTDALVGGAPTMPILRQHSPWLPSGPIAIGLDPDRISSAYGVRRDPISGASKMHQGVDIPMATGDDVRTLQGGTVIESQVRGAYGHTIVVDHGEGLTTRYAHLSARHVQVGDTVAAGQVVGLAGQTGRATGPHLHLEVRQDGVAMDPLSLDAARMLGNVMPGPEKTAGTADDDPDGVSR
ncbi:MAG: peptidoglycan DD-metalloendopeptidase family protein [Acidobacteria bacterium]|jgi:murein DD-endopeptidase MepM/ murein hydrolase activator NlpD|nr:peptidoglycan DD-metalloendopeptidase family protein [Acidobacteriota bacterium]